MTGLLLALALLSQPPASTSAPSAAASAVLAEFDRMAALPLWPGFDPKKVPLAVWDGERTVLVRHPSPPPGFVREGDVWVFPGRHPAMRANTSTEIGGVMTATLLLDPSSQRDARRWASVMTHESFHVFQRQHHPAWAANEAELFTYPVDDAEGLALRRLESEAWRRALAAAKPEEAACWAARGLDVRRERFGRLPAGAVAYERGTELNEGLAAFVESLALGKTSGPELPAGEWAPADVRNRAYAVGSAEAFLLERFRPAWRAEMEAGKAASLDELLAAALAARPKESPACGFPPAEAVAARERAGRETAALAGERREQRRQFLERTGWRLEVVAGAEPLQPQGFDPLNVVTLGGGEVLHRRFVKLGNGGAAVEVLDRAALTVGAGKHPLFDGVRRLTVTGLAAEPRVRLEGKALVVEAEGVTARIEGAAVERSEASRTLTVKIP